MFSSWTVSEIFFFHRKEASSYATWKQNFNVTCLLEGNVLFQTRDSRC